MKSRRLRHSFHSAWAYASMLEVLEDRTLPSVATGWGASPLAFEPNVGQAARHIAFIARGAGYSVELGSGGARLFQASASMELALVNARSVKPVAQNLLPGVSNYFVGSDPSHWQWNIPTYSQVLYPGIYPGIDLLYHASDGRLEYDFSLKPGAVPGAIRIGFPHASLSIDPNGALVVHAGDADFRQAAPVVYQLSNGSRETIAARFVLQDGGIVGLAVGSYDVTQPLVIDPVFVFSTLFGGTGDEEARGVTVDAARNVCIVGNTASLNFPTAAAQQPNFAGGSEDAFVVKLSPTGTVLFATYLGGTGFDGANRCVVDESGNIYVVGTTASANFPTHSGAFQTTLGGGSASGLTDAFLTKLTPTGVLSASTYLGGSDADGGGAVAIDASGVYVTGTTGSGDFPTAGNPAQRSFAGARDGFVAKLTLSLSALSYSTYLGGSNLDSPQGLAINSLGEALVTGFTSSTDFPTAGSPFQSANAGGHDAFVTRLDANGSGLLYSSYLGGSFDDDATSIALGPNGRIYIAGGTTSADFPTVSAVQPTFGGGGEDGFVTELDAASMQPTFSTYLGGDGTDEIAAISYDPSAGVAVSGSTSSNFPTVGPPLEGSIGGGGDAFVAQLDVANRQLTSSAILGGSALDYATDLALDQHGQIYLVGSSQSSDFPLVNADHSYSGGFDAFITKVSTRQWTGVDVAGANDGQTRLLWIAANGRADIWAVDNGLSPSPGPTYGPLAGWTAKAEAAGSDGLSRILWVNTNGAASVWLVDATGTFQSSGVFGPIGGWAAQDITVGSDNQARVLWTNAQKGKALVWTISNAFAVTSGPSYGPYAGWSATRLAAGSDGLTRVLWVNTNGSVSAWLLNAGNVFQSSGVFGPFTGWSGADIAVGSDNQARVLWTSTSGAAAVWQISNAFSVGATTVYGPLAGWSPAELTADSVIRLLWNNVDGTAALWLLSANGTFQNAATYGPF